MGQKIDKSDSISNSVSSTSMCVVARFKIATLSFKNDGVVSVVDDVICIDLLTFQVFGKNDLCFSLHI